MRTVTLAEAEYSRKRMLAWAESDRPSGGGCLGDWVFGRAIPQANVSQPPLPPRDFHGGGTGRAIPQANVSQPQPQPEMVASKTPGAVQRNWRIPAEFPLCPSTSDDSPLATYFARLQAGAVAAIMPWGETRVGKAAMSEDGEAIFILGELGGGAIKPWSLSTIKFEDGQFVHESCGTFFTPEGAEKQFTLIQGLPWEGGDSIDDYC